MSYDSKRDTKRVNRRYATDPEYRARIAAKNRRNRLKKNYGITEDTYNTLMVAQSSTCAVCMQPDPFYARLQIDHDHQTGKFRGLLCCRCNRAIGQAQESPDRLMALAQYLIRSK